MRKILSILLALLILLTLCVGGVYGDPDPTQVSEPESAASEEETAAESPEPSQTEAAVTTEAPEEIPTAPQTEPPAETENAPSEPAPEATDEPEPAPAPSGTLTIHCDDTSRAHWYSVERLASDGSVSSVIRVAVLPGESSVKICGLRLNAEYRITDLTDASAAKRSGASASTMSFTDREPIHSVSFSALSGDADWLTASACEVIRKGG